MPILLIAIFSYNNLSEVPDYFTIKIPTFKMIEFRYLQLSGEEGKLMSEEITKLPDDEAKAVLKLPNSYIERGIKQGIEKVVREMYKKGLSEELILEVSKLPIEKLREIKLQMDEFS